MSNRKEYNGEKIIARLTARLIPPSARYPDSICSLVLTERHLYILEDNYNGTYETLFVFFIERIRNMEAQIKDLKYRRSALGELFLSGIAALFGGIIYSSGKKPEDDGIRFIITYEDGMGACSKLYFRDLQSNSNHMVKEFRKRKDTLHHCYER